MCLSESPCSVRSSEDSDPWEGCQVWLVPTGWRPRDNPISTNCGYHQLYYRHWESLLFIIIAIEKSTNRGNKILNITLFSGPNGLKSNCSSLRWFSEAWGKPHNNTYGSHLSALASCFTDIHLIHPIVYWNTSTKQKFNYLCFVDSEGKNDHLYETDKFLFANYASVCLRKIINQLCWFRVLAAIFSNLTLASF